MTKIKAIMMKLKSVKDTERDNLVLLAANKPGSAVTVARGNRINIPDAELSGCTLNLL